MTKAIDGRAAASSCNRIAESHSRRCVAERIDERLSALEPDLAGLSSELGRLVEEIVDGGPKHSATSRATAGKRLAISLNASFRTSSLARTQSLQSTDWRHFDQCCFDPKVSLETSWSELRRNRRARWRGVWHLGYLQLILTQHSRKSV